MRLAPADLLTRHPFVRAQAGTRRLGNWIPAFAGMNGMRATSASSDKSLAPQLRQRTFFACDRIALWQRHRGNRREGLVVLRRIAAAAEVIRAFRRVGADDEKIVAA